MVSLWDNGASVEGRLSGSTDTFAEICGVQQQTHPRLDMYVIEGEHRSEATFVLTLNCKDISEDSKSIVES